MQNQQELLWEIIGYNQNNINSSGGSSIFKFQQDNDSVGSPTLTTNSERSEITEASSDFSFQKRFQENFAVQQQIYPQHSLMQQSGYDEMQLLQQQVMLKQLQALQRQQQHQQQNFLNPYSTIHKQANSGQLSYPGDEMPLNDSSQGYINWSQRSASPAQQGTFNRPMFSMGIGSQQFDLSLYGTPVANSRSNIGQQPPIHVMYQEPNNLAARSGGQPQKSVMQFSELNNSFLKDQYDLTPAQLSLQEGTFMSNLGVQGRGMSDAGSVHGLNNGTPSGNLLMGNSQQIDTSLKDSSGRQEQGHWSSFQQKDAKLDPLEEKILFNMEDSSISEIASGVFGDKFESVNFSSSFPSIQSGSWSALMQTAVAEASSSDTGLQEEFSGLTYQNMEPSADNNNTSNFIDASCVDKTLQASASLKSKPLSLGSYSDVNSSFPGFQLPSDQSRTGIFHNGSTPDSTQRSSNVTGHWVDCNPQQKLHRVNQQVQSGVSFDNVSTSNMYMQSPGVLDEIQSQTGNYRSMATDTSFDPSQGGNWANLPGHLGKPAIFTQFIQQNDPATVSGALNNKHGPQMLTINPFVASQPDNATFPGISLDAGFGGHTSSQSRSPQQGTNKQFNVWMDLPTRQHPFDQESLKVPLNTTSSMEILGSDVTAWQKAQQFLPTAYNMPQRVGLHQQEVAATKNISDFTASNKDFNKFQGQNNMDFGNEVGPNIQRGAESLYQNLHGQNYGLKMSQFKPFEFDDPKMEQNVCFSGKQSSGSNVNASVNIPASTPMWFKQMQPAHDSQETPDQLRPQGRVGQDSRSSNTMNQDIDNITPKKRKLLRIKHLAWHEEVCNVSQRDHTISSTEDEWAQVANLLVEKVKYDTQTFEFALPSHRSKRRLVLTSQLMQQLFHPPPTFVLFSAASSSYDSLLFSVARATLGDACSLTQIRENALLSSSHEVEKIPEKTENVERRGDQHPEVAKKLTEKAKKLQESFERLGKTPSIADIKFEIEDLERFSVINRFARFHSRGPVENSILNSIPQRYIAVGPMPRYLPEEVKGLAL